MKIRNKSANDLLMNSLEIQMDINELKKPSFRQEIELEVEDNTDKSKITKAMKALLSATFHLYYKAHAIHWNVEGFDFPQYHDFFGEKYEELHGVIDRIAEYVRILGDKAPATLKHLISNFPEDTMSEEDSLGSMISSFANDNTNMITLLRQFIKIANHCDEPAIENFLQERLDYHQKLSWMLRSIKK